MVGTPARQSCVSLGLNALGVAIFALSLTAPGIVSVPCSEFERAWATTVGESLPVPHHAAANSGQYAPLNPHPPTIAS